MDYTGEILVFGGSDGDQSIIWNVETMETRASVFKLTSARQSYSYLTHPNHPAKLYILGGFDPNLNKKSTPINLFE